MASEMERENKLGQTAQFTKVTGSTTSHKARANFYMLMEIFTRETGLKTKPMAKEPTSTSMGHTTMEMYFKIILNLVEK
jgi:hypothetical protein